MPVRVRQCDTGIGGGDFLRSGAAWMDTQRNARVSGFHGVDLYDPIAGIKPGPRYYKETTVPFEQDYLCATCKETDRSCPMRNYAVEECSFYSPDSPNVYQPSRKHAVTEYAAVDAMLQELERARAKHPQWPTDIVHQVAIMVEEAGEAMRAALNYVYEGGRVEDVQKELVHTGAMAIRVLMNLERGNGKTSPDHASLPRSRCFTAIVAA